MGIEYLILAIGVIGLLLKESEKTRNRVRKTSYKMSPYCPELVFDAEQLVDELSPDSGFVKEAKEAAHSIFEKLKQEGYRYNLRIARTKLAGSVGKGTAIVFENDDGEIVYPDLDLVVFVNDTEPPFKDVLESFQNILEDMYEVSCIKVKKFSIELKYETPSYGEIKVDLLGAENHVKNTRPYSGQDIAEVAARLALMEVTDKQQRSIMQSKKVSQEENKLRSSSFAEKTVQIIQDLVEDDFTLDVVMLAKYWNAKLQFGNSGYVPARSCIIELLAIHTQRGRRSNRNGRGRDVLSGFRRFLEAMKNFSRLDVTLVPDNENAAKGLKNYSKPMIRDPANTWNNLAEGIPLGAISLWKQQARKTLDLLNKLRSSDNYYGVENAIDALFSHKS